MGQLQLDVQGIFMLCWTTMLDQVNIQPRPGVGIPHRVVEMIGRKSAQALADICEPIAQIIRGVLDTAAAIDNRLLRRQFSDAI